MATIKIDRKEISENVIPLLDDSKTYIEKSKHVIQNINIPSDFTGTSEVQGYLSALQFSEEKLEEILSAVKSVVNDFETAEANNKSILNELNNLTLQNVAIGVGAGVTARVMVSTGLYALAGVAGVAVAGAVAAATGAVAIVTLGACMVCIVDDVVCALMSPEEITADLQQTQATIGEAEGFNWMRDADKELNQTSSLYTDNDEEGFMRDADKELKQQPSEEYTSVKKDIGDAASSSMGQTTITTQPAQEILNIDEFFLENQENGGDYGIGHTAFANLEEDVDASTLTSYVANLNNIVEFFRDKADLFEETFGFALFKELDSGETVINDEELFMDYWLWGNDPDTMPGGSYEELNNYLMSKTDGKISCNVEANVSYDKMLKILQEETGGLTVQVSGITLTNALTNEEITFSDSQWVKVTGMQDGKIIVSYNGYKYYINSKDIENGIETGDALVVYTTFENEN